MLSEFERAAWDNRTDADKHQPSLALKVVLDDIERGKLERVKHICVIIVNDQDDDGGDTTHMYQAGSLSELAVEGALMRVVRVSQEG